MGDTCWYVQEGSKGIFHGRRYLTQSLGALPAFYKKVLFYYWGTELSIKIFSKVIKLLFLIPHQMLPTDRTKPAAGSQDLELIFSTVSAIYFTL